MKKILPIMIVIIVFVAAGSFYGGMKYQSSKTPARGQFANFNNLSAAERQQMGGGVRAGAAGRDNVGFINGEILSKDDQSVTVKLRDGGSKIIFYSTSTTIGKMTAGTKEDLVVGTPIMATGKSGADGTLTAETIQIRSGAEPVGSGAPIQPQQ